MWCKENGKCSVNIVGVRVKEQTNHGTLGVTTNVTFNERHRKYFSKNVMESDTYAKECDERKFRKQYHQTHIFGKDQDDNLEHKMLRK